MSMLHCFDSQGNFDLDAYIKQRNKRRAASVEEIVDICLKVAEEEESLVGPSRRSRNSVEIRGHMPKKRDALGNLVPIDPQDTVWWQVYVQSPPLTNKRFNRSASRITVRNSLK